MMPNNRHTVIDSGFLQFTNGARSDISIPLVLLIRMSQIAQNLPVLPIASLQVPHQVI
jgi:hypothetical protein